MSRPDRRSGDRARRILERLAGSSQALDESAGHLEQSQVAERLHQIEQLFLLHGGERAETEGRGVDEVLFEWGHLEVLERLGQGSFGEVYRAYDRTLDREVALKLLRTEQDRPFQSQLFLHEARQLARVRHRNVLAVHGAAVHEGRPGLWADLINGARADDPGHRAALEQLDALLEMLESLCRALQAVHQAGLVHGDIKPSNIMRDEAGEWILMDFGASLDIRRSSQAPVSTSGTPLFMAPEVVLGQPPDTRSDLYSLGATLYRVLGDRPPCEVDSWSELKALHKAGRRPVPCVRLGGVDKRVAVLVDRLLDRRPEQRPGLDELLAKIRGIREAPHRRFRTLALTSIAGLLVVGLTLTSFGFYRANEARIEAEREQRNTAAVNRFLQRVLATPSTTGRVRDLSVEDMLHRAAEDVAPVLHEQPGAQAAVHHVLAESFNTLRLPIPAEEQIRHARERLVAVGEPLPAIERGLELEAARAAEHAGRYEESIAIAERFVATHLDALGESHPQIRWARMIVVTNHLSLGRQDEAENLVSAWFADVPDPETAQTHFGYEILQAQANLHRMQGRYEAAVEAAERALDWLDRYPLVRPNNRLNALTNLALNLAHVGRPERSIEVLEAMLPIQERMYGVGSGEYLGNLVNLSAVQREAGRIEDSGSTLALARELILDHPDAIPADQQLAVSMNLANFLNATGEQARGEALIRESIVQASQLWNRDHVNVLKLEYNLAELLNQLGRHEEARTLAEGTVARKTRVLGEEHAFTLLSMDNLALALAGIGQEAAAMELHERAYRALDEQLGPQHPFSLLVARNRLSVLQRFAPGRIAAGELDDLLRRHEEVLGVDHPDTRQARGLIGSIAETDPGT